MSPDSDNHYWVGILLSALIFLIIFVRQVLEPYIRSKRMKFPYRVNFRIAPKGAERPTELEVDANSECHMQLSRTATLSFTEHELIVGFEGDAEGKPVITEPHNKFIKKGQRLENWYLDDSDNFHEPNERRLTRTNTYTTGLKIVTKEPGR